MGRQTHHQRTVHAGWTVEGNDEAHPTALSTDWSWQPQSLDRGDGEEEAATWRVLNSVTFLGR